MSHLLLASLAQAKGDIVKMRESATEAVRWDPNNFRARIILAQAHIAGGNREQAAREAELALELHPFSFEAASALARARGESPADDSAALRIIAQMRNSTPNKRTVEDLIEVARGLSQAGKLEKARIKLVTAIDRPERPCPDCHRELALISEKMGRYPDAIAEWERFAEQAPERASTEGIKTRIEALRQRLNPKR